MPKPFRFDKYNLPDFTLLAVVDDIDRDTLAAIDPQTAAQLAQMLADGAIPPANILSAEDTYQLPDNERRRLLANLADSDPGMYRQIHEDVVVKLAALLAQGNMAAEGPFDSAFERLASLLFTDDTAAFLKLIDDVQALPLQLPASRQRRLYFNAVALFKRDELEQSLAAFDALLSQEGLDPFVAARGYNARSVVLRLTGRPEEALAGYVHSLALWRKLGNQHFEAMVQLNRGILEYELRAYANAESHLQEAAQLFTAAGPESAGWLAAVNNELGLLYRDLGRWDEALHYLFLFQEAREAVGATDDVGLSLLNIGEIRLLKGNIAQASQALQQALVTLESGTYKIDVLLFLGLAAQAVEQQQEAVTLYTQALEFAEAIGRREFLPHIHYHLAGALSRLDRTPEADAHLHHAVNIIEEMKSPLSQERLMISLIGRWQQVYEALVLRALSQQNLEAVFEWSERTRARAFAMMTGSEHDDPLATLDLVQQSLAADQALFIFFTTGVLAGDSPMFNQISDDNPLRKYVITPGKTILLLVTRENVRVYDCPIDPNSITLRSRHKQAYEHFLEPAVLTRMRSILLEQALSNQNFNRLLIIPHGPLHRVPFSALIRDRPITFSPSATMLLRSREPSSQQTPGLAIGYNSSQEGNTLFFTEAEVRIVAELANGDVWTGPEPKKDLLRHAAQNRPWLHFACHGWFNEKEPLSSYLLTGAGERLTAGDILESWQLEADLVVLSACQTGESHWLRGDEPMGLVRAFLVAGANAVLVSQWPVDDLATYLFMQHFYARKAQVMANDLALHQAKKWLMELKIAEIATLIPEEISWNLADYFPRQKIDEFVFAHPRYWAAFRLMDGLRV